MATTGNSALRSIWTYSGLEKVHLERVELTDHPQALESSFHSDIAAQASIASAALAAEAIYFERTGRHQSIRVEKPAAELECTGYFTLDGKPVSAWEKFSGLYPTRDGHVRIHANFDHHRDGVLKILGLPDATHTEREDVAHALEAWDAEEFETRAAAEGLVVAKVRCFEEWDRHPHGMATRDTPLLSITRIGESPPRALPAITAGDRPLTGVRVLDLTRILAGPICGRTLAAYGADVMLVNSPNLPNISSIIDTSRGKRSVHLDLRQPADIETLTELLRSAQVFVQGYRPSAVSQLGFSPRCLTESHPGIVYVSLSAYGNIGPWSPRRGFDSLVQTATGFNHAEAEAFGSETPRTLPMPILDYASGFLMAFGAEMALHRQINEGGSWHVEVSLLQTANWLRGLGRREVTGDVERPDLNDFCREFPCADGVLKGVPHAAQFSSTPATWDRPSALPGAHLPCW